MESRAVRLAGALVGLVILVFSVWLIGPVRGARILMGAVLVGSTGKPWIAAAVVAATVLGAILPFLAIFLPRRQSNVPRTLIMIAATACLIVDALVVRAFAIKDPTRGPEKPPPPDCRTLTRDTAAIGRNCDHGCPSGYLCTTASLASDVKSCQIVCSHSCECPTGYVCEASVCGRVK